MKPATHVSTRFWPKVRKGDGCWIWLGANNGKYGHILTYKVMEYSHRVSWEIHYGPIQAGMNVLHRCDNPLCVRPDHLFLGTQSDNIKDCVAKGRFAHARARGERHAHAKLTESDVLAIRADSRLQKDIARQHGITQAVVSKIKRRRLWGHLQCQ
jgi:DNA-binding CsgD family transcriptional regulator